MPHRRALCGPASRRRRLLPAVIGSVLAFVGAIALAPTALGQQSSSTAAPSTINGKSLIAWSFCLETFGYSAARPICAMTESISER